MGEPDRARHTRGADRAGRGDARRRGAGDDRGAERAAGGGAPWRGGAMGGRAARAGLCQRRGRDALFGRGGRGTARARTSCRLVRRAGEMAARRGGVGQSRSEEHTSELQSLMRISYAVFCLKKKIKTQIIYCKIV